MFAQLNSDLEYQYREGVSCLSLPPGRYMLANGLNCPVEGYYWFCDVISDPAGNYKTVEMHPYTGSNHNFYYFAKYSGGQWTGWEKYPDSRELAAKLTRDARVSEIGFSDSASDPATIYVVVDGSRMYIPVAPSNFGIKRLYVDTNPDTGINALRVDWQAYGTEHTNWINFSK